MTKAFDTQVLTERLKAQGLPVLEDTAEKVVIVLLDWVKESALLHENLIVKAVVPAAIDTVKPLALTQVDKIDGQVG